MRRVALVLLAAWFAGCGAPTGVPDADAPSATNVAQVVSAPPPASPGPAPPRSVDEPPASPPPPPPREEPPPPPAEDPPPAPVTPPTLNTIFGMPPRPIVVSLGPDATTSSRFASATVAADGGSFAVHARGVGEATLRADALLRLTSTRGAPITLALSSDALLDPRILAARLLVGNASMDLTAAAPSVQIAFEPWGVVDVGLELTLGGIAQEEIILARTLGVDVYEG